MQSSDVVPALTLCGDLLSLQLRQFHSSSKCITNVVDLYSTTTPVCTDMEACTTVSHVLQHGGVSPEHSMQSFRLAVYVALLHGDWAGV
jgi:hypothetical protein